MENIDKIMARVRALFDRAESTTFEGERESCLEAAQRLMIKYHIESSQIDMSDETHSNTPRSIIFTFDGSYSLQRCSLLNGIADIFSCKLVKVTNGGPFYDPDYPDHKHYYQLFGYEADIDIVWSLHDQLDIHMMSELKNAGTSRRQRISFMTGYNVNVLSRMKAFYRDEMKQAESDAPGTEIVLASKTDKVGEHVNDVLGKTIATKRRRQVYDPQSFLSGEASGKKADITLSGSKVGKSVTAELT